MKALAARRRHPLAGRRAPAARPAGHRGRLRRRGAAARRGVHDRDRRHRQRREALPGQLRHLPRARRARAASAGPSLIGVGAAAVDFQVGTGRMPLQATGPQAPAEATSSSSEQEIAELRRTSRRSAPARRSRPRSTSSGVATTSALAEGGELFRVNCAMCHNFAGAGGALTRGKYAPALDGVDREAHLRGDGHRPAVDAGLQRRQHHAGGEAETSSPTSRRSRSSPAPVVSASARSARCREGLFAWVGLLAISSAAPSGWGRSRHEPTTSTSDSRRRTQSRTPPARHGDVPTRMTRCPTGSTTRACRRTSTGWPTPTHAPPSGPSARSCSCSRCRRWAPCSRSSPTSSWRPEDDFALDPGRPRSASASAWRCRCSSSASARCTGPRP